MARRVRFTITAELSNISTVADALRAFMVGHMPDDICNAVELGVVEALTNIVSHGCTRNPKAAIEITFQQSDASAIVEISDSGKPIPPEELKRRSDEVFAFDPDDIQNLPEGGMGLALIKELFDAVHYESANGANKLVMAKRFGTDIANKESDT